MKITSLLWVKLSPVALLLLFATNSYGQKITVENSAGQVVSHFTVEIPVEELSLAYGEYMVVADDGEELPLEIVADLNGRRKAIFPVARLGAGAKKAFQVKKGAADRYPKRTYAELAHKIGGEFVSYEPIRLVVLSPRNGYVEYYFMPTWELDWQPVRNEKEFRECLDGMMRKLNHSVSVIIK